MELQFFRHLWGLNLPWEQAMPAIRQEGYAGVEAGLPPAERAEDFARLLEAHRLGYIAQIFTGGRDVAEHLVSFRAQLQRAAELRRCRPILVNCHSGCDAWTAPEALAFFAEALRIEADAGVPVAHETHRGRVLFAPWVARVLLERLDDLWLCADFSHWVCVCERLLDDQRATLELCAARCRHVHARVGYEEGPQVPDPAAPEYQRHLLAHEAWWGLIWAAQRRRGEATTTMTPEFGPPAYLHTLPYTQAPVADLGRVCQWMAQRQRARFAEAQKSEPQVYAVERG